MPYFKNSEINLLLIHIPKTGGTSIEQYFSKKFSIKLDSNSLCWASTKDILPHKDLSLQHLTYNIIMKYKDAFNIDTNKLKIISVVRNPYERIMSDLFYFKLINKESSRQKAYEELQKIILNLDNPIYDNHFKPQYKFLIDANRHIVKNIKIFKTESLTADMHAYGFTDFNRYSNTNEYKINYMDYLNNDTIKLINTYYTKDFELFNYTKIIPSKKCDRSECNYVKHDNLNNNGGTHCCLSCKKYNYHGPNCKKLGV